MYGYAGKILRINLTSGEKEILATSDYEEWGGGHGIGSALFYDIAVKEKNLDLSALSGFDPDNVVIIMTSPLSGTLVPGASSRTEVQGIGVQTTPEWFTRGNFGGRFAAMLKYAGWDGIVIEGKAEKPVWIDIRNQDVRIQDAGGLWGKDTWETQEQIWSAVTGGAAFDTWIEMTEGDKTVRTTQRPAVLAIGQA
ncbi:MAG: aldehyde ferredoxin oxidoreductase N-terminal domain-containing protein, partial [Pseudomonadota bacterium]